MIIDQTNTAPMSDVAALLPPNATATVRNLTRAAVEPFAAIPVPIRDVWNPDTCPVALLPWLAWAMSVDTWEPTWPENIKRSLIRNAIDIQRRKGTARSVHQVVEAFGGSVVLTEWWEKSPTGAPHTFDMVLAFSGAGAGAGAGADSAAYVDAVISEVERAKPVRSHFTFTQAVQAQTQVGQVAAGRAAVYARLQMIAV
ncbi:phage tail protein I [Solilutibacter silvestris]|uniref:Phage tail protein I n=1 Tax=Solilutibacter silvestris TaxID=1645665 RepID=A0A2K1Q3J1_9GAMM|nr:phage tail protein I [Lysobacter silvestris]PNS09583.1 phage tail protein I [Lysobacter silvestris]